jgi:signal transduction histidine kinase
MTGLRLRRPMANLTVRTRLTAWYSGVFLAVGVSLLAIIYLLQEGTLDGQSGEVLVTTNLPALFHVRKTGGDALQGISKERVDQLVNQVRADSLHHLLIDSSIATGVLAVACVAIGWWLAGRTLAPLHRITLTARRLSTQNLHERIELTGPSDELKELADTFDAMLARLEDSFNGQQAFIANVSHELRTPLAIQRAAAQIGLAHPTPQDLTRVRRELLECNRRSELLIDGLLTLARSDGGLADQEVFELDDCTREAVAVYAELAANAGVRLDVSTQPSFVSGDRVLLTQLAGNLVHNAIRYNQPGGRVEISVTPEDGLRVTNTGPVVPQDRVAELFQPFHRLASARTGSEGGAGLGLSIVESIARAHHARVIARAPEAGGLDVRVSFTAVPDSRHLLT